MYACCQLLPSYYPPASHKGIDRFPCTSPGYKNMGEKEPGVEFCWPFWKRISHVVNKALITYSAPSRQVPTADNVMVDINLSVLFAIGPDTAGAEDFVYKLGTPRFDEFLSYEVEEGIRGLVYSVTHDRVNDLREEFAVGMLHSLARKFHDYGVVIQKVKITETALPRSLAATLEETTTFRTKIAEKAKKHENSIRVLSDQASQELETILRTNQRREQDLTAQCARYEIEHTEKIQEMVGSARVAEIEARSHMDVLIAKAKGDFQVATAEGEKDATTIRRNMEIESNRRKVKIEEQAAVTILQSEGKLRAAENNAKALVAAAEGENASTTGLEMRRKYELEWERLSIVEKLASSGRRFVSGATGQQMIREMVPTASNMKASKSYF
mmetsp:Transcript_24475/g.49062  ORF Transcript_24475/g.49062 Transcript_24475/m.49062 type:complete len:385 (-) Transcript_24475:410-1564(-)